MLIVPHMYKIGILRVLAARLPLPSKSKRRTLPLVEEEIGLEGTGLFVVTGQVISPRPIRRVSLSSSPLLSKTKRVTRANVIMIFSPNT